MELSKEIQWEKRDTGVGDLLKKINHAVKSSHYFRSSLSSLINSNATPSDGDNKSVSEPAKSISIFSSKRGGGANFSQGDGGNKILHSSSTKFTMTPQLDGYVWRKYGEKKIVNSKFPRCYYRCTYYNDLNCSATKQVQQCNDDDTPMYKVTYFNEHTCNNFFCCNADTNNNYQNMLDFTVKDTSNSHGPQLSKNDVFPVISSPSLQKESDQGQIDFESIESDLCWLESYAIYGEELLSEDLMYE